MEGVLNPDVVKMTDHDFNKISQFIYSRYGIKMPANKKTLLESRLQKRLKTTSFSTFKDYLNYLFTPQGQLVELIPMVNAVTTNKTDFFRGPDHFELLANTLVPEFIARKIHSLKVWSAGCSTGEEPYTMAMTLSECKTLHPTLNFSILGTDLSSDVLQRATRAVYSEDNIADIPLAMRRKYLLQSKVRQDRKVRIVPTLRERVVFERLNLMDEHYKTGFNFHVIFCRNVLIYFDRATQERVINKLLTKLEKGGYLFIGHSESLTQMNLPVQHVKATVFRKL